MTAECPYALQWDAPIPPKNCPFPWGNLDLHLVNGSLGPPESSTQTASWSVQTFLHGSLLWQTDKHTMLLGSVTTGCIYMYVVLRCGLTILQTFSNHNWIGSTDNDSSVTATRSSVIAQPLQDALSRSKCCQLLQSNNSNNCFTASFRVNLC